VPDVSFSPALRWSVLLLLLLSLTLGWKVAVQQSSSGDFTEPYRKISDFLVREHFTVRVSEKLEVGAPTIHATAGPCRILVATAVPEGSDRDRLRSYATDADTVFVVFGGRVYAEQPTWLTSFDSLWAKFRREIGFKAQPTPVFFVIATKNCDAERLPWGELG
jgi:hypothetical protein